MAWGRYVENRLLDREHRVTLAELLDSAPPRSAFGTNRAGQEFLTMLRSISSRKTGG